MSNKVFWRVPGLRPLGIELGMDFTSLFYENAEFYYNQFYTGLHAYYKVPLLGNWTLLPRFGGGITNLEIHQDELFGEILQGEIGYAFTLAFSAQKEFRNGILLEFGLDVRMSKYTGGDLDSVHPWMMGGYRF